VVFVLSRRIDVSGSDRVLARTTAGPLARDDDSCDEELSAPHSPRLAPLECTRQALRADGTTAAQRLGELHVARRLGEEELRVLTTARQLLFDDACTEGRRVEDGGTHLVLLLSRWGVQLRKSERPRFPGFGFRGLEAAGEEWCSYVGGLQALVPGKVRTSATTPVVTLRSTPLRSAQLGCADMQMGMAVSAGACFAVL
jgi:hypothetical protein